jgi:hypothetical protein
MPGDVWGRMGDGGMGGDWKASFLFSICMWYERCLMVYFFLSLPLSLSVCVCLVYGVWAFSEVITAALHATQFFVYHYEV